MLRRTLVTGGLALAVTAGLIGATPALGAEEPAAVLEGRVTLDGEPVAGLDIEVHDAAMPYVSDIYLDVTDANGYFRIDEVPTTAQFPRKKWLVSAQEFSSKKFPGFLTYAGGTTRPADATTFTFAPGSTTSVDIALVPAATVTGRVVNAKGKPLRGVEVMARNLNRSTYMRVYTNRKGVYTVSKLGTGPVELDVSRTSSGWGKHPIAATVMAEAGETTHVKDIVFKPLPRPGKVKGKVTRLKKNDRLYLLDTKTRWLIPGPTVKKKGALTFTKRVRPGTYRLVIAGTNKASKKFKVRAGKTTKVPRLKGPKKRYRLKGKHVRADGTADEALAVSVYDRFGAPVPDKNLRGNGKKKYTARRLGKGKFTVQVTDGASWGARATVKAKVKPGKKGKVTRKNVTLKELVTVTGTVTHDGQPVRGIHLSVLLPHVTGCIDTGDYDEDPRTPDCLPTSVSWAVTDEDGRFTVTDVPVGKTSFRVHDPVHVQEVGYQTLLTTVRVRPGSDVNFEVQP